MHYSDFHIFKMGAYSWGIQWKYEPSRELLQFLLAVKENLRKAFNVEVIHTYNEILLKNLTTEFIPETELKDRFREIIKSTQPKHSQKTKIHRIPVCYDPSLGEDIEAYIKIKSMTIDQLITMHTEPLYTIYFMGFLPGFPYLDGLDDRLHIERKAIPSQRVQQGSVAIGGKQTGIYPQDSPGGWYTIGHTPITLFDITNTQPSPFMAGDYIKFYAIDTHEYQFLKEQAITRKLFPMVEVHE